MNQTDHMHIQLLLKQALPSRHERIATAILQGIMSNPSESAAAAKHANETGERASVVAAKVAAAGADALIAELDNRAAVGARYEELLFAVASKFPGESRHETALRYIREREGAKGNQGADQRQEPQR